MVWRIYFLWSNETKQIRHIFIVRKSCHDISNSHSTPILFVESTLSYANK